MPDEIQETVKTRALHLVDAEGKDRAILATGADGTFSMRLLDSDQTQRTSIAVSQEGNVTVAIGHCDNRPNVSFTISAEGHLLIEAIDSTGVERIKLEMTGNGSHTELSFSEKYRKPRMVIMAEDKGPAGLFIMDQHGRALFSTTP